MKKIPIEEQIKRLKKFGYRNITIRVCSVCGEKFAGGTNGAYCWTCSEIRDKKNKQRKYFERSNKTERERGECYFCEKKVSLHIHHIDKNHSNNEENNLITLCNLCHNRLHGKVYAKLFGIINKLKENNEKRI